MMVAVGMLFGYKTGKKDNTDFIFKKLDTEEGLNPGRVEEIIRYIDLKYVDEIQEDDLLESAIMSILEKLDPHSIYLPPEDLAVVNQQMEGAFKGLGIEVVDLLDSLFISSILPDGPAELAGIQYGDVVLAVNDSLLIGRSNAQNFLRQQIEKNAESEIELKIQRGIDQQKINIKPDYIDFDNVTSYMIDDVTGLIKINRFSSNTFKTFMKALEPMSEENGLKDLVIDLRGNPGGYLPEATKILCQVFKEKDKMLVYTEGNKSRLTEYKTTGKAFFDIRHIAVLVDENSASGSEIIAGAIQDWDRGIIVGRRTFGKGLVQEQYDLRNGGAIRLTVAEYFTPSGRLIQRPYENKSNYREEFNERQHSDEMVNSDKMKIVDTTEFKTMVKQRTVYGGGGIIPDHFIAKSDCELLYNLGEDLDMIAEFSFIELKNSAETLTSIESFLAYLSDKEYTNKYLEFLSNEDGIDDQHFQITCSDFINTNIKAEMAYQLFGNTGKHKALNTSDKAITETLKALNASDIFAELK